MYRIVKTSCWWSEMLDTNSPQYLYYDFTREHFEIGSYAGARKSGQKMLFSAEEIEAIERDFGKLGNDFVLEEVKWAEEK